MSNISNNFSFTKEWTDSDDFPTKEYSEPQVRADIQQLFDELKDFINSVLIPGINDNASSIAALGGGGEVDTNSLADECVTSEKIKDKEITELKYADDSIPNRALQEACVENINLADDAVTTRNIEDGSVTAAKMASNSVATAQLQDNSVTTSKIVNGNVTADKLGTNSVTTVKIADGNVTEAKLGTNAVTSTKIKDGAVVAGKLGTSAVATTNLADGSVTEPKLASNSVTTSKIADLNVTTGKLANSAVTTAKIADGNVTAAKLGSNSVTTAKITNGNVTAEKLDSSTVDPYVNGLIDAKATALAPVRGVKGSAESSYRTGQVNITKANIGLGNVENKSAETILGELTSSDISQALGGMVPTRLTATKTATINIERGSSTTLNYGLSDVLFTPTASDTFVTVVPLTTGALDSTWSMAVVNSRLHIKITNDNISGTSGGDNTDPFCVTVYRRISPSA